MLGDNIEFPVLNAGKVSLYIRNNPFSFAPGQLFQVAARRNPKRFFLFVSTLLGKHLAVSGAGSLLTGAILSGMLSREMGFAEKTDLEELAEAVKSGGNGLDLYAKARKDLRSDDNKSAIFIGFAETATALGHSVFDCFGGESCYFHSTREKLSDAEVLFRFEEEHSHATSHIVYCGGEHPFRESWPVVLVDDEITTGKTALNIISDIQGKFPRQDYYIVSIMDMRSEQERIRFQQTAERLGVNIRCVSLFEGEATGTMESEDIAAFPAVHAEFADKKTVSYDILDIGSFFAQRCSYKAEAANNAERSFLKETGRFGIHSSESDRIFMSALAAGRYLSGYREKGETLCLGTGEFMFLPMLIAAAMGERVCFKSTTRSPIWIKDQAAYPIRSGFAFRNIFNRDEINYLYNLGSEYEKKYDDIFVFLEHAVEAGAVQELGEQLQQASGSRVTFVHF